MFEDYPGQLDPTTSAIDNVIRTLGGIVRGEGLTGRAVLPPLPEIVPDAVRDVRDAVAQQLEGYHVMLRHELRRGVVGAHVGASRGTDVLEALLAKASFEGDTMTVEGCVSTLGQLARGARGELADASWAGRLYVKAACSGSVHAMNELHTRLEAESEYDHDFGANSVQPPYGTYLLGAVNELGRSGLPAHELIDKYAASPTRKLAYYLKYLEVCRANEADIQAVNAIEDQVAEQFYELPRHVTSDTQLITKLLLTLRQERLRWHVFDAFRHSHDYINGDVQIGSAAYIQIMDALLVVPPSELNDDHRAELENLAHAGQETISGSRFEMWKVDAAVAEGRPPHDVIQYVRMLVGNDSRRGSEAGQTQLIKEVDEAMSKYAARYAAVDEFGGAQVFLGAISDPNRTAKALTECMLLTQTAHQRARLRPGDMTVMLYPGLATHAELASLLSEGDAADSNSLMTAIRKFALDPATSFGVTDYGSKLEAATQHERDADLCDRALRILDPQAAIGLAREIKDSLDNTNGDSDPEDQWHNRTVKMSNMLAQLLVRLGEPEETKRYYTKLHEAANTSGDPVSRWVACMNLADLLFDRRFVPQ